MLEDGDDSIFDGFSSRRSGDSIFDGFSSRRSGDSIFDGFSSCRSGDSIFDGFSSCRSGDSIFGVVCGGGGTRGTGKGGSTHVGIGCAGARGDTLSPPLPPPPLPLLPPMPLDKPGRGARFASTASTSCSRAVAVGDDAAADFFFLEDEPTDQRALTRVSLRWRGKSGEATCSQTLFKAPGTTRGSFLSAASTVARATAAAGME